MLSRRGRQEHLEEAAKLHGVHGRGEGWGGEAELGEQYGF